jgi:hypothetical protein
MQAMAMEAKRKAWENILTTENDIANDIQTRRVIIIVIIVG